MRKRLFRVFSLILCVCMLCSVSGCDLLANLGHKHDFVLTFNPDKHWQECSCGEKKEENAHQWDNGVQSLAPTYESKGEMLYTCVVCSQTKTEEIPVLVQAEGEISFHFLTLGNKYAGDCVYVKAGEVDILIDGGSRANSVDDIQTYVDKYVIDNTLEYVIITHADQDHIACFGINDGSLFDIYQCETIIDFPLSDKTTKVYERYQSERLAEVQNGAKHFTALECYNSAKEGAQRVYQLADGISMEILYNYYYENSSPDENNYSVCVQFTHGSRKFLFTGDLEKEGEEKLVEHNDLSQVELFKAGHHGSKTSSNDCLLDIIKPNICVVTCVGGTDEYTDNVANQFPTQAFIDRISKHTQLVYVTSLGDTDYTNGEDYAPMNGDIVVSSTDEGVNVTCSNNDTLLKDTEWFKNERQIPALWN